MEDIPVPELLSHQATMAGGDGVLRLASDQVTAATTQPTEGPNTMLLGVDIEFGPSFLLYTGRIGQTGAGLL